MTFSEWIDYFQYVLNIVLIVVPLGLVSVAGIGFNIWVNIAWHDWWAEGNVYLILNTVWMIASSIDAMLISLEYPKFMRSTRVGRFAFLFVSVIFLAFYAYFTYDFIKTLFYPEEGQPQEFTTMTILYYLMIGYNLILHAGSAVINLFIVCKELSLEFFSFLRSDAGSRDTDDISIGFSDQEEFIREVVHALDFRTWV